MTRAALTRTRLVVLFPAVAAAILAIPPGVQAQLIDLGYPEGRALADVNGDGKPDYCRVVGNPGSGAVKVSFGFKGGGFTAPIQDWGYPEGRAWKDFNGDGKADYLCVGQGTVLVSLTNSQGTDMERTIKIGPEDIGYPIGRFWLDVNKDGMVDYLRFVGAQDYKTLRVSYSNGHGFGGYEDITLSDSPGR